MATKAKFLKAAADTYMDLIGRLRLKPINDVDAHARAAEMVGELIGRKLDAGASDYLDTLILLVNRYEDEHHTPVCHGKEERNRPPGLF